MISHYNVDATIIGCWREWRRTDTRDGRTFKTTPVSESSTNLSARWPPNKVKWASNYSIFMPSLRFCCIPIIFRGILRSSEWEKVKERQLERWLPELQCCKRKALYRAPFRAHPATWGRATDVWQSLASWYTFPCLIYSRFPKICMSFRGQLLTWC